jgi:hypothetical protein
MARTFALILGALALAALVAEFHRLGARPALADWDARLWRMARFFTILTNALVAVVMLAQGLGRRVSSDLVTTAVLNIAMVGAVYQVLLRPATPYAGLHFWTDLALHALVPLGAVAWWLAYGPRGLANARIPRWLVWPLAYCLYALWRGGAEGRYPYFFVDVARFGWAQVGLNIAGLVLVFGAVGWAMAALSRRLR